MKQRLLFGFAVCATAAVSLAIALNANFSTTSSDLSDVALANVEALASSESGDSCKGPKLVSSSTGSLFCQCTNLVTCKDEHGCD